MNTVLFLGPSLTVDEAVGLFGSQEITVRPPVRRGDVWRAIKRGARAIAIVDGVFGLEAAVAHKELLLALELGIAVFGAASMGALRAAELDTFGMMGCGVVYCDLRDGLIWRDDEVAVVHAPAELGYVALTEALVNVRATVRAAINSELLDDQTGLEVMRVAAALFFAERTWDNIIAGLKQSGVAGRFDFLASRRVDQKKLDAVELCRIVAAWSPDRSQPPNFTFVDTDAFQVLREEAINPFLGGSVGF
jgi:hypothetical protein